MLKSYILKIEIFGVKQRIQSLQSKKRGRLIEHTQEKESVFNKRAKSELKRRAKKTNFQCLKYIVKI